MDTKGDNMDIKGFWCDGVILEEVFDKYACFTAYSGKSGQIHYNLFLRFGEMSSKLYAEGADLKPSVPDIDQVDALVINVPNKRIYLDLN